MDIFIYILIFIIGTLFGSFYTLAVYRIPKRQDITHTHSYCPNCNHKLGFLDLIPILSYIFLGGKCRYCKQKIRSRYLILELLSGTLFLVIAILMNINFETIYTYKTISYCFIILYFTFIILICGIDKETKKVDKLVLVYGIVISILYMVYLCIVEKANIYRYVIYLVAFCIILFVDNITLKKHAKSTYLNNLLIMIIVMIFFTEEYITANSIIISLLAIAISLFINKIKNRKNKKKDEEEKKLENNISIGFYIGFTNVLILLVALFYNYMIYVIKY